MISGQPAYVLSELFCVYISSACSRSDEGRPTELLNTSMQQMLHLIIPVFQVRQINLIVSKYLKHCKVC
jgi:hypothetical protein